MQSNHSDFNHKLSKLAISTDKLLDITREIGHEKLELTLVELRDQLEAPFTFVIVGEVKAGKDRKSTRLNSSHQI